jgi:acetylornithine/succinyldiaminopimelate/putrescine aminotransferase
LLSYVADTSTFLKIELARASKDKGFIHDVRGQGTFIGFDVEDPRIAESMQQWFLHTGLHIMQSGPTTFGLRPSLLLGA